MSTDIRKAFMARNNVPCDTVKHCFGSCDSKKVTCRHNACISVLLLCRSRQARQFKQSGAASAIGYSKLADVVNGLRSHCKFCRYSLTLHGEHAKQRLPRKCQHRYSLHYGPVLFLARSSVCIDCIMHVPNPPGLCSHYLYGTSVLYCSSGYLALSMVLCNNVMTYFVMKAAKHGKCYEAKLCFAVNQDMVKGVW